MEHLRQFAAKTLTSRKFWATLGAVITFGAAGEWHEAGLAIMGYVGVQGGVDFAKELKAGKGEPGEV